MAELTKVEEKLRVALPKGAQRATFACFFATKERNVTATNDLQALADAVLLLNQQRNKPATDPLKTAQLLMKKTPRKLR